jgi:hypothetical protein
LLGGNATDVPVALRPLADALDALVAAPSAAELRGEAAIRAQFLAQRPLSARQCAVPVQATGTPSVPFSRAAGPVPPRAVPTDPVRPRRGRHSRSRRARPDSSRPAARAKRHRRSQIVAAVTAGAALAVLLAATYTGALPSPVQRLAHMTIAAPATRTHAGSTPKLGASSAPAAPSTDTARAAGPTATASAPPTASPSVTPDQVALCNAFLPVAENPAPGQVSWKSAEYRKLVAAAGGRRQVYSYCAPVWDKQFPGGYPRFSAYPPYFPQPGNGNTYPGTGNGTGDGGNNGQVPGGRVPPPGPAQSPPPSPNNTQSIATPTPTPSGASNSGADQGHRSVGPDHS